MPSLLYWPGVSIAASFLVGRYFLKSNFLYEPRDVCGSIFRSFFHSHFTNGVRMYTEKVCIELSR